MDEEHTRITELADILRPMTKTAGWQALRELVQVRLDECTMTLALPLHERRKDQPLPSDEFLRGAIFGLQFYFGQTSRILTEAETRSTTEDDNE